MGNYINVSIPRMKGMGDGLHADIEKIPQFINELDDSMRNLGQCWEGPAWMTFQQQVESDILNVLDVYDWMRRFLQALSEGEKIYGTCEKNTYDFIDKVRI